jgi:hypothetical protein
MSETHSLNDQYLSRAIRKAIVRFNSADKDDIEGKLRAVMAAAALGAVGAIRDTNIAKSTIGYIEAALAR